MAATHTFTKPLALGTRASECRSYLRLVMSQELVLTVINTTFEFNSVRNDFESWLRDAGASEVTIRSYVAAIQKWLKILALNPGVRPVVVWQRSNASASVKRVVGYACRRYTIFASEVFDQRIDLGIPSRLPAASRPNPKPISEKHLRELGIAAKQLFPVETSLSFRVWIQFLNETGCRRSESEIDWSCIDWLRRSVVVRGKTGERELPLVFELHGPPCMNLFALLSRPTLPSHRSLASYFFRIFATHLSMANGKRGPKEADSSVGLI